MIDKQSIIKENEDTEFFKTLQKIFNADDFLCYCCDLMDTEEKRQKLLDYIKQNDITDSGDVIELVSCIDEGIEPEFVSE